MTDPLCGHRETDQIGRQEKRRADDAIPAGHPEGYLEGFAQIYCDVAEQIQARWSGRSPDPLACTVPTVEDGARGMKFIDAVVESSRAEGRWTDARLNDL